MDMGQLWTRVPSDIMANQEGQEAKIKTYSILEMGGMRQDKLYLKKQVCSHITKPLSHTKAQWDKHTKYNGGLFFSF